jgi:hypothetical protein
MKELQEIVNRNSKFLMRLTTPIKVLNRIQKVEVSDTTGDAKRFTAGNKIISKH